VEIGRVCHESALGALGILGYLGCLGDPWKYFVLYLQATWIDPADCREPSTFWNGSVLEEVRGEREERGKQDGSNETGGRSS